jgi:hypothetical protein
MHFFRLKLHLGGSNLDFNAFKFFVNHENSFNSSEPYLECRAFEKAKFMCNQICKLLRNISNAIGETITISLDIFTVLNLVGFKFYNAIRGWKELPLPSHFLQGDRLMFEVSQCIENFSCSQLCCDKPKAAFFDLAVTLTKMVESRFANENTLFQSVFNLINHQLRHPMTNVEISFEILVRKCKANHIISLSVEIADESARVISCDRSYM